MRALVASRCIAYEYDNSAEISQQQHGDAALKVRYYNPYLYAQHRVTNQVLNLGMYRGHSERLIPSIQNPNSPNPFAL